MREAILSHYQELFPQAVYCDQALLFADQNVVIFLNPNRVLVCYDHYRMETIAEVIKRIISLPVSTALDKVNRRRGVNYLARGCKTVSIEYCDPGLFDFIDEVLGVPAARPDKDG